MTLEHFIERFHSSFQTPTPPTQKTVLTGSQSLKRKANHHSPLNRMSVRLILSLLCSSTHTKFQAKWLDRTLGECVSALCSSSVYPTQCSHFSFPHRKNNFATTVRSSEFCFLIGNNQTKCSVAFQTLSPAGRQSVRQSVIDAKKC